MSDNKLSNLINRIEGQLKHSPVHLLLEEAIQVLIEQDKKIRDLEAVVEQIDSGLCEFIHSSRHYEPATEWGERHQRAYKDICKAYNDWHANNPEVGRIAMDRFLDNQSIMRKTIVRALKENLYRTRSSKEAQDILERMIRRYEDDTWGMV